MFKVSWSELTIFHKCLSIIKRKTFWVMLSSWDHCRTKLKTRVMLWDQDKDLPSNFFCCISTQYADTGIYSFRKCRSFDLQFAFLSFGLESTVSTTLLHYDSLITSIQSGCTFKLVGQLWTTSPPRVAVLFVCTSSSSKIWVARLLFQCLTFQFFNRMFWSIQQKFVP